MFFAALFSIIALIVIACCVRGYQEDAVVSEMVKAGANPLAASCAIYGFGESSMRQNACLRLVEVSR